MAYTARLVLSATFAGARALSFSSRLIETDMGAAPGIPVGNGDIYYPAPFKGDEQIAWNDRVLKPNENDAPILDPVHDPELGKPAGYIPWDLCNVKITANNLGGLGPDFGGEQSIRYKRVGGGKNADGDRVRVDLVITANSSYSAMAPERNGVISKESCFGLINVASGSDVELLVSFYETGTNKSVSLSKFYFTVYDMDRGRYARETTTFYNEVNKVYYTPTTTMRVIGELESGLTFVSRAYGTGDDNPKDPLNLTAEQRDKAAMVELVDKGQFKLRLGVLGQGDGGRNFVFAGLSNLIPDTTTTLMKTTTTAIPAAPPTPAPTTTTTSCFTQSCQVYADPHVSGFDNVDNQGPAHLAFLEQGSMTHAHTFDRRPVDVDAFDTGDFWLVKNNVVYVQARFRLSGEFIPDRAAIGAVAVGGPFIHGHKLIVEPLDGSVTLDGVALPDGSSSHHDGLVVLEQDMRSGVVSAVLPSHVTLNFKRLAKHIDVRITMPPLEGGVDGECGNYDGVAENDDEHQIGDRMGDVRVDKSQVLFATSFEA